MSIRLSLIVLTLACSVSAADAQICQTPTAHARSPQASRVVATGRTRAPRRTPRHVRTARRPNSRALRAARTLRRARTLRTARRTLRPARTTGRTSARQRWPRAVAVTGRTLTVDSRERTAEAAATPAPPAADAPLGPRLLNALSAGKLELACRLAAWASRNPAREHALRTALYLHFPSPTLLDTAAKTLRKAHWQSVPGRDTLLRLLDARPTR